MARFLDISAACDLADESEPDSPNDVHWRVDGASQMTEPREDEVLPEPVPAPKRKKPDVSAPKKQVLETAQYFLTFPQCETSKEDALENLKAWCAEVELKLVDYIVAEEEHKDGAGHLHVYFKVDKKVKMRGTESLDMIGGKHGNYQGARSCNAVIKYCAKGDNYLSNIDIKAKLKAMGGKHKYICSSILTENKPIHEIIDENPEMLMQANTIKRGIDIYYSSKAVPRSVPPTVLVHWGPSGTGKSHAASVYGGVGSVYFKPAGEWWPGYRPVAGDTGHTVVVIDEFDKDPMSYEEFLTLTDRYAKQVPIKGGHVVFNSPTIIFTSTQHPRDWWPTKDFSQVSRRITKAIHFTRRHEAAREMVDEEYDHDQARLAR